MYVKVKSENCESDLKTPSYSPTRRYRGSHSVSEGNSLFVILGRLTDPKRLQRRSSRL